MDLMPTLELRPGWMMGGLMGDAWGIGLGPLVMGSLLRAYSSATIRAQMPTNRDERNGHLRALGLKFGGFLSRALLKKGSRSI